MAGMCDTCHAGCCRAYNLLITAYDALVISQDLGLPTVEFVTLLTVPVSEMGELEKMHTGIRVSDPGHENDRFLLALKRVDSALFPGTLKCYFLQEWRRDQVVGSLGDHPGSRVIGRCGIYGSRPMMCRTYPTALHGDGSLGFIDNPPPSDMGTVHEIYKTCPGKWEPQAFSQNPAHALHTLILNKYEIDFQNRALAEWNRNPGFIRDFFPWMVAAYGNRFRHAHDFVGVPPEIGKFSVTQKRNN